MASAAAGSSSAPDALDALRQALASSPPNDADKKPLGDAIRLLGEDGAATDDVSLASAIEIATHPYAKTTPTRLARSRNSAALAPDSTDTPASAPDAFFALDAIVFALQTATAQGGLYVVQATAKSLPRFEAIERADILAYLTGKRPTWEGVLSVQDVAAREQRQRTVVKDEDGAAASQEAGPSTTPPGSPPMALRQLHGQSTARLPPKRPYVHSRTDAAFVKRLRTSGTEIVLQNRNNAMHGSHPWSKTADFSAFRAALAPTIEAARKAANAGQRGREAPTPASHSQPGMPARKQRAQDPIIILSNSPTALVNMFNVKRLLEDGVFVDPMEARKAAGGLAESMVIVNYRLSPNAPPANQPARTPRVLVVDNVEALTRLGGAGGTDVWARVVAVFTTGQAWQFKSYPYTEPRELFKHVLGVYVRWHNEQKSAGVRDWPVTELVVDRSKRHTDRQVVAHFWRNVEGFVARRKPHLL